MGDTKMLLLTAVFLISVSSILSSSLPPPPDTTGLLYNCVVENWGGGKDTAGPCLLCFTASQQSFLETARTCSEQFLPTANQVCSEELASAVDDNEESVEDILECFEDTLENMTAERCLALVPEGLDTVETLVDAAMCLSEAKANTTFFIETFLGVEPKMQVVNEELLSDRYSGAGYRHCWDMSAEIQGEEYAGIQGEEYAGIQGEEYAGRRDVWLCLARAEIRSLVPSCAHQMSLTVSVSDLLTVLDCVQDTADNLALQQNSDGLVADNLVLVDALV